ncbi:MAG: hypothetical protein ACFFDV_09200 [Candidatus Thorarchaeota archaeon]
MRTCAKCGKANDVTRKYCTRCGASLLKTAEEPKPKPSVSIPEVGRVVTGASMMKEEPPEEVPSVEEPSLSDEERIVRPSEVSVDRVRTAERHIEKTEYEKAQETFADSEKLDPDERMLRASELQGLEAEVEESSIPAGVGDEPEIESEPSEHREGKEVVKQILERVRAAEALAKGEEDTTASEVDMEAPTERFAEADSSISYEEPMIEAEVEESYEEEPAPPPPVAKPVEERMPVSSALVSTAVDEIARDEKIRSFESDIKAFTIEKKQLQSEYDKMLARLDEEVERYRTTAETKRIRAEGIERELKLAKKEFEDANKEYKNVENRRKKELSNAEKRIDDVDKRVKKAEDGKEKRIRDLEKERQKREEEAAKG